MSASSSPALPASPALDDETRRVWSAARRARDARFDGQFFVGVRTTGIYCRPTCPARTALERNVEYFRSAAAAGSSGYIACLRCRPESAAPWSPHLVRSAPHGDPLERAVRLIDEGALDPEDSGGLGLDAGELAAALGVGERSLRRAFVDRFGATPTQMAMTRRLHLARQLLLGSQLRCADIGLAVGFGSARRFNHAVRRAFGRSPAQLRRKLREHEPSRAQAPPIHLSLGYRPPFAWHQLLAFLAARAIPGVEEVTDGAYRRAFDLDGQRGVVTVYDDSARHRLRIGIELAAKPARSTVGQTSGLPALLPLTQRLRQIFDLSADPRRLEERLAHDPILAPRLRHCPGIRVPGAWGGFELTVRAVLGQQVTVRGATTLASRFVSRFGASWRLSGAACEWRSFPRPEVVAGAGQEAIEAIGLPRTRARCLHAVAELFSRQGGLNPALAVEDNLAALRALPGIGPWTAQYVALRALRDPDAFPEGDLVLRQRLAAATGSSELPTARQVRQRSLAWRPLRAYAVMLLWQIPTPAASQDHHAGRELDERTGGPS